LIIKTILKEERNFELTPLKFVGLVNLFLANSKATVFQNSLGNYIKNLYIESIEFLLQYTIAAQEQVIFATA